jgi:hypothetical protein
MGGNSSKSIDPTKKLNIIFDTFPNVDYRNGSESNLLEKNIYYKNYIIKNIIRAFRRISNVKIIIPNNQLFIKFKITPKPNVIYYEIQAQIEFVIKKEIKNIELPNKVSLMSNININIINNNYIEKITFELLAKTIYDVFKKDIVNKKKIQIDKNKYNYIDLNNDFIQNIQIYHENF